MSVLSDSWNSFAPEIAARYLKSYGSPSESSKILLLDVLRTCAKNTKNLKILDLGCGNGQIGEFLTDNNFSCEYTGVDFSEVLLDAAKVSLPKSTFFKDDINSLEGITGNYDVALFSHVFELLSCPENSLSAARKFAKTVVIRFYEPPEFEMDTVDLRWLDIGSDKQVPYIRRKMSKNYYQLILSNTGCKSADIYRDSTKDQVHVLHF